jgi:LAO/AO transport system kinase
MHDTDLEDLQKQQELIEQVRAGNFRTVAKLLTMVENHSPEATSCLKELFRYTGECFTIGITGAPGAGKSTLVDRLAEHYRSEGKKIGIIAVDPTSPFSGGAILGDRIRMQARSLDPGTFIRSMATRGHVGGLTSATADVLTVMDAAGFDIVLLETVGVGQGEVEVAKVADATIVMLVPGMGDDIQAMKAGIMEIADLFVINKADHPGADYTETVLKGFLLMCSRPDGWTPGIVRTVASEGGGIGPCIEAINAYRAFLSGSKQRRDERIRIQKERLLDLTCEQARERLLGNRSTAERIHELAGLIVDHKLDPFTAADEVMRMQPAGPALEK